MNVGINNYKYRYPLGPEPNVGISGSRGTRASASLTTSYMWIIANATRDFKLSHGDKPTDATFLPTSVGLPSRLICMIIGLDFFTTKCLHTNMCLYRHSAPYGERCWPYRRAASLIRNDVGQWTSGMCSVPLDNAWVAIDRTPYRLSMCPLVLDLITADSRTHRHPSRIGLKYQSHPTAKRCVRLIPRPLRMTTLQI